MVGRYPLSLVAIGSLVSAAQAAEPFLMVAEDTASAGVQSAAPPAPFRMEASDIVYSGSERAEGEVITRNADERVFFLDSSSAADSTIVLNEGGAARFQDRSTAEAARLTVNGTADFSDGSNAGSAGIVTNATGVTRFSGAASAGSAVIENNGRLAFEGLSDAANSAITNNESGTVTFAGSSSAGGGQALTNSGTLRFTDAATADARFVANNQTGRVLFEGSSNAGESVIANSGSLRFADRSGLAAGRVVGNAGGTIEFGDDASAGSGEISHAGTLRFSGRSSAGSALVETQTGGTTFFVDEASGASSEIRLQAGSVIDFSGLATRATSVASILGNASILLGGTALTVGDDGPQRTAGGFSDGGAFGGSGGSLVKVGSSVLGLEGANRYTGATAVREGTLLGASEGAFAPRSAVMVSEGALLDLGGFDQEIGSLAGGGRVDLAANILRLGGDGRSTVFSGSFGGAGGFDKLGGGTFVLTGASENFGASLVAGGTLVVDGSMPLLPVTIRSGATLSGAGTLGSASVETGGRVALGRSNLTLAGDLSFEAGSALRIAAGGAAGRLTVGGTARLGAADVVVDLDRAVSFLNEQRFTILQAGAREQEFARSTLTTDSAFLTSFIDYDDQSATLVVRARDPGIVTPPGSPPPIFVRASETPNQSATAGALDGLDQTVGSQSLALYNAILFSNAPNARAAFDQLSGEASASVRGALVDGSGASRGAVLSRLNGVFGVVAQGSDVPVGEGRFLSSGFWADGFGAVGRADGNGNAARADRDVGGIFLGGDTAITSDATLGLFGGYSHGWLETRGSSAEVDTIHAGAYGGAAFGSLEILAGAAYAWNSVDVRREVAFPGFSDTLSASYDADVAQVFGEIGYRTELGGVGVKPFAGIAYVHLDADGFTEQGGAARLTTNAGSSETVFTTLGLRADHSMTVAGRELLLRGMAGWRHASGDTTPSVTSAFLTGLPFTVEGASLSKNAAVLEAGFSTQLLPNLSFDVDYVGLFGEDGMDNGLRFGISSRF